MKKILTIIKRTYNKQYRIILNYPTDVMSSQKTRVLLQVIVYFELKFIRAKHDIKKLFDLHLGIGGHNQSWGHNHRHVDPSCVHIVYFLRKYIDFHVIRTECQIIIIHLLLLISHTLQ